MLPDRAPRETLTRRQALLLLVGLLLAFWAPTTLRGRIVFPHDNSLEIGASRRGAGEHVANRKFIDLSHCYVPELQSALRGDTDRWLSTWNPHVGLGRPAPHTFGFTKAYVLTHVLSWFDDDPFRAYTHLVALFVVLAGLFCFAWLDRLGLHPAACLAGAASLATGTFFAYWLSFSMFLAGACWGVCALWLVERFLARPSLLGGAGIAFAIHSLLLTAYPQQMVHFAWFLPVYALVRTRGVRGRIDPRVLFGLGLCALAGVVSVAPVYADLIDNARRSTRWEFETAYFLASLPELASLSDLGHFLARLVDASWEGNPIRPEFPTGYFDGFSLTPLYAVLVLWTVIGGVWRRAWGWQLLLVLCVLGSLWPALYAFGVEHMGLNVSRWPFLRSAPIPVAALVALGADGVLRRERPLPWSALALGLVPLAVLWIGHGLQPRGVPWGGAAYVSLALFAGVLAFGRWRDPRWLVALVLATTLWHGRRLVLDRPPESVRLTSPLVEALQRTTADGSRYALLGARLLPSNQESLFDLRSIHTYDTLASRDYERLVSGLSESGMINHDRHFTALDSVRRISGDAFAFTAVGTIVSDRPLGDDRFEELGFVRNLTLYAPRGGARREVLVERPSPPEGGAVVLERLPEAGSLPLWRIEDRDDRLRFSTGRRAEETLLFVSQQHHPAWVATVGGRRVATERVNGFYLGVRLPPGGADVVLEFRPAVLWAWVPQALFALLALAGLVRAAQRRRRDSTSAAM